MTKTQLRRIREDLGLSMREFARLVAVDPATITRWESGQIAIPAIAEIAIRAQAEKMKGGNDGRRA